MVGNQYSLLTVMFCTYSFTGTRPLRVGLELTPPRRRLRSVRVSFKHSAPAIQYVASDVSWTSADDSIRHGQMPDNLHVLLGHHRFRAGVSEGLGPIHGNTPPARSSSSRLMLDGALLFL